MNKLALIEVRSAKPEDFKTENDKLKIGQPYFIIDQERNVLYHYTMTKDVALDIFAEYLKNDMIRVPVDDEQVKGYLRKTAS